MLEVIPYNAVKSLVEVTSLHLSVFTGRPAQSTAMSVLFLLSSPKIGFLPQ